MPPNKYLLFARIYKYSKEHQQTQTANDQIRQPRAELKRSKEERDILRILCQKQQVYPSRYYES